MVGGGEIMRYDDMPEFDLAHNYYTGPYYSDGKFQSSVADGTKIPVSKVDYNSRIHDASYYHAQSYDDLTAADRVYSDAADNFHGLAWIIGKAPLYGNFIPRLLERFEKPYTPRDSLGGENNTNMGNALLVANSNANENLRQITKDRYENPLPRVSGNNGTTTSPPSTSAPTLQPIFDGMPKSTVYDPSQVPKTVVYLPQTHQTKASYDVKNEYLGGINEDYRHKMRELFSSKELNTYPLLSKNYKRKNKFLRRRSKVYVC
jgi:hypothetical protein